MITQLATAIMTKFDADSGTTGFYDAINGQLWYQQAPQSATAPYAIFNWVGSTPDDYMGGTADRMETADIRFSIFSKADDGGIELAGLIKKCTALFDWSTLTYTDYDHIKMERISTGPIIFVDEIWQNVISYEVTYNHQS